MHRILIVDDDADIRTVARLALTRIGGYEVEEASSGAEAISLLEVNPFGAILLDVTMPTGDGPTFLESIRHRAKPRGAAIFFFTARVLPDERRYLESLGADGVIEKPFDPLSLSALIGARLRHRTDEADTGMDGVDAGDSAIERRLDELWARHRLSLLADVERLEVMLLADRPVDDATVRSAREAMHRLCGAFGIYGRDQASEVANSLQSLVRQPSQGITSKGRIAALLAEIRREVTRH